MTTATKIKPFYELAPDGKGGTKLRVNLHDGQTDIMDASDDPAVKHIVASCGTQSGKTCLGSLWTDREIDWWLENIADV